MANGEKPTFSGVVQETVGNTGERKLIGRIALWYNESLKDKAPYFQGEIRTNEGKKYRLALWNFRKKEGGL